MELDKLIGRLRREIAASPKKAAILGVLLLVAVVYWTPLVWGWIKPDEELEVASKETPAPATARPVAVLPAVTPDAPAGQTGEPGKHPWRQVAEWMENDPRMVAASDPPGRDHPFDAVEPPVTVAATTKEKVEEELKKAQLAAAQANLDPASLGLALSSTIVGSRGQAALINGRTYRLGNTVRLDHSGQPIDFQLSEILVDRIVLQRDGKQYEVRLPEPTASSRLEVRVLPDR